MVRFLAKWRVLLGYINQVKKTFTLRYNPPLLSATTDHSGRTPKK